jgi:hypothetical protein
MTSTLTTPTDHAHFEAICAHVDDWEHLPAVLAAPTELEHEDPPGDHVAPLDGLILAGLVSPF